MRFQRSGILVLVLGALTLLCPWPGAAKRNFSLEVRAGEFARHDTVVTFAAPPELKGKRWALRDRSGHLLPIQLTGDGAATFVLPKLAAGATEIFTLIELGRDSDIGSRVELKRQDNLLNVTIGSRSVFTFVAEPRGLPTPDIKPIFLRGGYIHPVYTPSGRMVTDDYPEDHFHHHGIWFAWTKTQFEGRHPDFWNVGTGSARIEFGGVSDSWSGPVAAGFKSQQRYVDLTGPSPKVALNEEWEVRAYYVGQGASKYFMFDIVATQRCASTSPLLLEEYRYGGMGVRGHHDWKDKGKVFFLTSENKNRENGNATRARWCYIGGPVQGQPVGMAVLAHPANFQAPEPLRLNPDDPFFNYAPSQAGPFEIKPGSDFVLRYRYVVADGAPDAIELNRMWNDYAHPPQVRLRVK